MIKNQSNRVVWVAVPIVGAVADGACPVGEAWTWAGVEADMGVVDIMVDPDIGQ